MRVMATAEGSNDRCVRICVTPTRNEAWIINQFLAAVKTWADHVIVADQGSTDGTLQQLQNTPGVEVVINDSPVFDEAHRQKILLERARQFEGRRILIALDADEVLSANCLESKEWKRIADAEPGTVLRFRWVNVLPGFQQAWIPDAPLVCGFIDDGSEHKGVQRIHNPRLPCPINAPVIDFEDVVVLHFQYAFWERMISKHRWYQAWEYLKHQQKGPLEIFREYHHMYGSWEQDEIHPIQPEWFDGYKRAGIDFRSLKSEPVTWWDREIVEILREHGPERFRRIAIWDKDWNAIAARIETNCADLSDPRSPWEKTVHRLLAFSQPHRRNWGVRAFEYLLRKYAW
jgi:hypothetical protein